MLQCARDGLYARAVAAREALYRTSAVARSIVARDRTWTILFLLAAAVSFLGFLYAGRNATFWHDEWAFIQRRQAWDIDALFLPHNEHWATVAVIAYKSLLTVFGLRTYVPYQAVLLLLHVIAAAGVFQISARQVGRPIAFGLSLMLLFLSAGNENIFWAFQITFVGAAAAGTWALALLLETGQPSNRRLWAVAGLALVAVATSGIGLFFLTGLVAVLLINPDRRRHAWIALPAIVAFGAWSVVFGRSQALELHFLAAPPLAIAEYVVAGISNAAGHLLGLGEVIGGLIAALLIIWAVARLIGVGRLNEAAIAGLAGLLAQYAMTGLVRAQFGVAQVLVPRYVTIGAIFLLLLAAAWLGSVLPRRRARLRTILPLALIAGWALTSNLARVHWDATQFAEKAFETRAAIELSLAHGGSPALPEGRRGAAIVGAPYLVWFPSAGDLRHLNEIYGLPSGPTIPADIKRRTLFHLISPSIVATAGAKAPTALSAIEVEQSAGVAYGATGDCLAVRPVGDSPWLVFPAAGGSTLYLTPDAATTVRLYLSLTHDLAPEASREYELETGPTSLTVPDLGDGSAWYVRLDVSSVTALEVCLAPGQSAP
jgi:hypothetical protein